MYLLFDLIKERLRLKQRAQFSFSVQIDDCAVTNWKNYCDVGRVFTCPGGKKRTVKKADRAALCWDIFMSLVDASDGDICSIAVPACECFNNLSEVENRVCVGCPERG